MKTQILLDTTFIPTYEMYVEFCEDNDKVPQNEESNDYWDFVEFEREIEVNDFFINLNGSKVNNNHYWVITGSLGLWDGRKEIALVKCDTLFDAILKCVNSCDDFVVEKCGNKVCVTAMHHDGRNYFEIRALSDIGNDRFNRLGNISLNNRENLAKLEKYLF
jgi:hypothetical protein